MKTAAVLKPVVIHENSIRDAVTVQSKKKIPALVGYTPCTIKQIFRDGIDRAATDVFRKTGIELSYFAPMGCGGTDDYDYIWKSETADELPDVIVSLGFGDFFRTAFRKKFIDTGLFHAVLPETINPAFEQSGIIDPENKYTVYGLHPYVMLIDKKLLGDLPLPEKWDDLLSPQYKGNIIIGGNSDEVSEVLLMHLYKDHGEEGIRIFARNVKAVWHGSQMAKFAGSGRDEGAAINVISHFFAAAAPETENSFIHIPSEGMIASPLYMIVRKGREQSVKPFTDYILGSEFGKAAAEAHYPVLNGAAGINVAETPQVKWIGWDYIRSADIFRAREHASEIFRNERSDLLK